VTIARVSSVEQSSAITSPQGKDVRWISTLSIACAMNGAWFVRTQDD
jgi:hypothetical protein